MRFALIVVVAVLLTVVVFSIGAAVRGPEEK
jgi:hypothetical protein